MSLFQPHKACSPDTPANTPSFYLQEEIDVLKKDNL